MLPPTLIPMRRSLARLAAVALLAGVPSIARADLAAYLARPEPEARWERLAPDRAEADAPINIDLVSQVWRNIPWTHRLRIFRPNRVAHPDVCLLILIGGRGGAFKDSTYSWTQARAAGAAVAVLDSVPNQPLFDGLKEDDLIAHTFQEYIKTGDEEWPLLFPMTKAAVKAMDAIQELSETQWDRPIRRFVVSGASKRGWTTWLAAAGDPRVAGIVPVVFDNLNFHPQMKHQIDTWGAFSSRIEDYTRRGLQTMMSTERGSRLVSLIDPYAFRDRLEKIPKWVVNGTNDSYWPLDAANLYWDDLKGPKWLHYAPNAGHGIGDGERILQIRAAFLRRVAQGRPLPEFEWEHGRRGRVATLRMTPRERPQSARVWIARSDTRDFRKASWESRAVNHEGGHFLADIETPERGFLALFGEAEFADGDNAFSLATTVRLIDAAEPAK